MKNIKLQINNTKRCLVLLLVMILFKVSFSQVKSDNILVNGINNSYNCHIITRERAKDEVRRSKYYTNANYDMDLILKEHKPTSPDAFFISYSINDYDKFIDALGKAFSKDRVKFLSKNEVLFHITFFLDKNGDILLIEFCSIGDKDVTPQELEILESNLLVNITFKPKEHPADAYSGTYTVRTSFKEIESGEIKTLRNKEIGD